MTQTLGLWPGSHTHPPRRLPQPVPRPSHPRWDLGQTLARGAACAEGTGSWQRARGHVPTADTGLAGAQGAAGKGDREGWEQGLCR